MNKEMQEVYIVAGCRTPIGKMGGALKSLNVADLSSIVFKEILNRSGITAEQVDEIVMGETRPYAAIHNVARHAALLAGFPVTTSGYTVQQACASGMAAIQCSVNKIMVGMADIVIAGGVESMSNAPFFTNAIRYGAGTGDMTLYDSITESQIGAQPAGIYGRMGMGTTAETVAEQYHITREAQDAFAHQSQLRYQAAYEAGRFDEIVPVTIKPRKGDPIVVDKDEHPRLTSPEKLAALKPVFKPDGTVTVGNACGRNDGACVVMLMSGRKIRELGIKPMAKIIGYSTAGVDPRVMGIGPIPKEERQPLGEAFRKGWRACLLPVIVFLPFLLDAKLNATLFTERMGAAGAKAFSGAMLAIVPSICIVYILLACMRGKEKQSLQGFIKMFSDSIPSIAPVAGMVIGGFGISELFNDIGVGDAIVETIGALSIPYWVFAIVVPLVCAFFGMFLESTTMLYMFTMPIVALAASVGFNPIIAAGMVGVMTTSLGHMTPPFGQTFFVCLGVAKSDFFGTLKTVIPWCIMHYIFEVLVLFGIIPIFGAPVF